LVAILVTSLFVPFVAAQDPVTDDAPAQIHDPNIVPFAVGEPKAVPAAPYPEDVLWDQYANWDSTDYAAQDFESAYDGYDIWAADDFENLEAWDIDTIVNRGGWGSYVNLNNATELHWYICADAGGVPDCVPGDGTEFWSASLPPSDPQVSLGVFEPEDVVLTLDAPIDLPAGDWWLVHYVSLNFDMYGQWGWSGNTVNWGMPGMQNNPNGGFGLPPGWSPNSNSQDYMYRLEGMAGPAPDIPWLSEDPTEGSVAPDNCDTVYVTFDSTGLAPDTYTGQLFIESNDPDEPEIYVPVTLTVDPCAGGTMHVHRIDQWPGWGPGNVLVMWTTLQIRDDQGAPVEDADVTVFFRKPNGAEKLWTHPTDWWGRTNFRWYSQEGGYWLACVDDVQHPDYTYAPGDNVRTCAFIEWWGD
jgi:hypothetical protein